MIRNSLDVIARGIDDNKGKCPFDLVIMDFEMPVMNGPDAAAEIIERGWNIPVVGLSGNVLPADRALFLNHGAFVMLQNR
jgi:CheY-like chemotaxis protein